MILSIPYLTFFRSRSGLALQFTDLILQNLTSFSHRVGLSYWWGVRTEKNWLLSFLPVVVYLRLL